MGILIIGIIVGSFLDLQINSAIFNPTSTFGLSVSVFGMIPGYGFLAFLGGITLYMSLHKKEWKKWARILMFAFSIAFFAVASYAIGDDIFNVNGFYDQTLEHYHVGYLVAAVIATPLYIIGYIMGKKVKQPKMWLVIIILAAAIFVAIVPCLSVLKILMRRPRYRIVVYNHLIDDAYKNWWEFNLKGYMDIKLNIDTDPIFIKYSVSSTEFKSFPSGHSAAAMITPMFLTFIPFLDKRLMKYQTLFFYLGFGWCLIMMFARMLVGAHYLTDTCFGALFVLIFFYIANEIILRKHLLDEKPEEAFVEEQQQETIEEQ